MSFADTVNMLINLTLVGIGLLICIAIIAVIAMAVWLIALYKAVTGRRKWRENKTPNGNPRV